MKERGNQNKDDDDDMSDDEMYGFDDTDNVDLDEKEEISEEEVYNFDGSDDEEEENDFDMGSDIEEDDGPSRDDRAWGKNKRRFYSTDYVDQDYEGFYEGKEAEEAELEEEEAKQIQKRLIQELNETDFIIAHPISSQPGSEKETFEEIERDLSSLSKNQKLDLLKKESPEFFVLVQDLKNKLNEIEETLVPILNHFGNDQETVPAIKFLRKKFLILTNYCTNISFYLLLKAKGIPVQNHPVLRSLYKYRKLLEQIQEIDEVMKPQIENILKGLKTGVKPVLDEIERPSRSGKNILKLLTKPKSKKIKTQLQTDANNSDSILDMDGNIPVEDVTNKTIENQTQEDEKRAITYEMAKNKGLTPKRNKDQRNPRVKHRKKYRKALVRRRGQVRTARNEIPVYGGEPTGIKAHVVKSVKLK